jgi:hypothetical protein
LRGSGRRNAVVIVSSESGMTPDAALRKMLKVGIEKDREKR